MKAEFYMDMIDDYVYYWSLKKKLITDIRAKGLRYETINGNGVTVEKANESVRDFASAGVLTKTDDGEWIWRQHTWICADSPFIDSIKFPLRNVGQTEFEDFEIVPGPVIDVNLVVDWCMEQMRIFDIKKIAMDTYRYTLFKQAFEERGISIEDKKNPHGIVRLIRKISSATGIIAPFIQSMFSQGLINFGQSAIMRWYTNNTSVTEDKFGNKSFGKIEPKLRKNDGFMAFDVAMFCKDELEVQIIYV